MSVRYAAVKWNRNKQAYDAVVAGGVVLYLAVFFLVGTLILGSGIGPEVLLIRALGTCAFVMLHVVLCIGPLARFDRRFLPVLYNRRHLGVATFLVGLAHATLATGYYHGFGRLNPLVSVLSINAQYDTLAGFPFELLGVPALLILFVMAATSHDFWLKNLSPGVWKALHMLVYVAYGLLVMHVTLGALQSEGNPAYPVLVGGGLLAVVGLHLAAGLRERRRDAGPTIREPKPDEETWIDVGSVDEIAEGRAKVVAPAGGERVAIFRYEGRISAVTNVCAHQRGPLGEGKIIDGCITCPWHGWEYRPQTGQSPPPFQERIATYRIRVEGRRILLDPSPLPPGTPVEPACFEEKTHV
jgi:nitrite reductase/ring-hydroxylating ferredoxin subunit/DMSO/TMAO reductase YedYZ heme-binding membrane subunit